MSSDYPSVMFYFFSIIDSQTNNTMSFSFCNGSGTLLFQFVPKVMPLVRHKPRFISFTPVTLTSEITQYSNFDHNLRCSG